MGTAIRNFRGNFINLVKYLFNKIKFNKFIELFIPVWCVCGLLQPYLKVLYYPLLALTFINGNIVIIEAMVKKLNKEVEAESKSKLKKEMIIEYVLANLISLAIVCFYTFIK